MLGYSFDWDRVRSTPPTRSYYKWTQWIFLQLYQAGPGLQDHHARQLVHQLQVRAGQRGGRRAASASAAAARSSARRRASGCCASPKYAQRLIDDLDDVDFIERVKTQQRNWIGRSTGAEVTFKTTTGRRHSRSIPPGRDTLFGATYMVLSPEHPHPREVDGPARRTGTTSRPIARPPRRKSDFERSELNKEKTGVQLEGVRAINPAQRQGDPHLHLRLCPRDLRHRRHHGRPGPRRPRLGVCQEVRPARSSRWWPAAMMYEGGLHRSRTTPASWSTPAS